MEITVTSYRRHAADCTYRADRNHARCGCPLWGQFNWPKSKTFFRGKKLNRGQNKWSLETRSWKEASKQAQQLENYLNDLLAGKPVQPAGKEVEAAVKQWLQFRSTNGISNTKARLLGDKLIEWCSKNDVVRLTALTPEHTINFRMSMPFRTEDSSSLSVHWSIINAFFNWAEGMGYIAKNPTPSARLNPQFKIKFKQKEVVPPTSEQVKKIIDTATGRVKLLVLLMRWTAMALVDAQKLSSERRAAADLGRRLKGGWRPAEGRFSVRDVYQNDWRGLQTPDAVRARLAFLRTPTGSGPSVGKARKAACPPSNPPSILKIWSTPWVFNDGSPGRRCAG